MATKLYSLPALSYARKDAQFVCIHESLIHLQKIILLFLQHVNGVLRAITLF